MKDKQITIIKEDGTEVLCDILLTYFSEEFNHNYVVFAEPGSEEVGAAIYVENGDGGTLKQIENDDEWALLEEVLEDYASKMEDAEEDDEEHSCSSNKSSCSGCGCGSHGCDN